jgi:hypothetical protein
VQEQATITAHAIKTEFFRQATVSEICTRLISAYLPLTPEDLGETCVWVGKPYADKQF